MIKQRFSFKNAAYFARYVYKTIAHPFNKIGFPVGFESNVCLYNARCMSIGNYVFIGKNVILQIPDEFKKNSPYPRIIIEDKVTISMGAWINAVKKVHIKKNVLIGPNVFIADHMHKYTNADVSIKAQGIDRIEEVIIEEDSWICANSIINPGVTIGKHAIVGANSVVTKNVPAYTVVGGSPAKPLKKYHFEF